MYAYTAQRDRLIRNALTFAVCLGIACGVAVWKALS